MSDAALSVARSCASRPHDRAWFCAARRDSQPPELICSFSVGFFLLVVPVGCEDAVAACAGRLALTCITTRTRFVFLLSLTAPVWEIER